MATENTQRIMRLAYGQMHRKFIESEYVHIGHWRGRECYVRTADEELYFKIQGPDGHNVVPVDQFAAEGDLERRLAEQYQPPVVRRLSA